MQLGALADWFVALFTGATLYIVWRQTRTPKPIVEAELQDVVDDRQQFAVIVRNLDQRRSIAVEDVSVEPTIQFAPFQGLPSRIEPGQSWGGVYSAEPGRTPGRVIVTIRANNRARRYKAKL